MVDQGRPLLIRVSILSYSANANLVSLWVITLLIPLCLPFRFSTHCTG